MVSTVGKVQSFQWLQKPFPREFCFSFKKQNTNKYFRNLQKQSLSARESLLMYQRNSTDSPRTCSHSSCRSTVSVKCYRCWETLVGGLQECTERFYFFRTAEQHVAGRHDVPVVVYSCTNKRWDRTRWWWNGSETVLRVTRCCPTGVKNLVFSVGSFLPKVSETESTGSGVYKTSKSNGKASIANIWEPFASRLPSEVKCP